MSLKRLVVTMIEERGCGNVDHLMPRLETMGFTRKQAMDALHNAKNQGFLWCEKESRRGVKLSDPRPATYWPGKKKADPMYSQLIAKKPEPARQMVSSVFQLGSPIPEDEWPKGRDGTVHTPLGPWNSEEIAA